MRVATLIISLVLTFGLFLQSLLVSAGGSVAEDAAAQESGSAGILVALLWLVAAGFVLSRPRFSMGAFGLSALVAFAGSGSFPDLAVWGVVAVVLAGMSWFGYREKRAKPARNYILDKPKT